FFQGGVAYNQGVKAAFEKVSGKKIIVPPQHDVLGAYGVALVAQAELPNGPSKFKGFDLSRLKYSVNTFECDSCPNHCEINKVQIEGSEPLFYGSRCGKYDVKRTKKGENLPRLFKEREDFLLNKAYPKEKPDVPNGKRIGIPRVSFFTEFYPFFKAFFTECGFEVVPSEATNRRTINRGLEAVTAEFCFPIKVAHGHLLDILEKDVDYIFLPTMVNSEPLVEGMERSYSCVYVQATPQILQSAIETKGRRILTPVLHFEWGERFIRKEMLKLTDSLGVKRSVAKKALRIAYAAQDNFSRLLEKRGEEVLKSIPAGTKALVVVSRPYNGFDPALNLNIPEKLRDMGVLAIPMDFLPLSKVKEVAEKFPHMYWKCGQKILSAATIIAKNENLYPVYISNFGCGPDSFIQKFFVKALEGKPALFIEIDEHSADVGAITRLEAFLDSLKHAFKKPVKPARATKMDFYLPQERRTIWIPHMDHPGYALAAAIRSAGIPSKHIPLSDEKSLELGRRYTSGKECYPCVITTGDMLKIVFSPGFNPKEHCFLMPDARGPCRFGQYNRFHRLLLDELGYEDVPVIALDQTHEWNKDLEKMGLTTRFRRLAWRGILVVDMMKKLLLERRPYEVEKGACNKLYWELISQLEELLEKGLFEEVTNFPKKVVKEFNKIKLDKSQRKPKIGIIGEIFVRSNEFSNNFIVDRLEAAGAQVTLPSFEEWMNYIDYERLIDYKIGRQYKRLIVEYLSLIHI
ncbi:MAG: acyl-CoA dehydratase activase-related protein, partial [Planctomycetota bacterium]|nr:acyl-CoA dehydratase activase-related protein [Planctomycetota bacterium]